MLWQDAGVAAMHEVLGDDLDGLAAELEDAEAMLGKEFWG